MMLHNALVPRFIFAVCKMSSCINSLTRPTFLKGLMSLLAKLLISELPGTYVPSV